jgi:hypothetical protein
MKRLRTSYIHKLDRYPQKATPRCGTHLNSLNIGVLGDVLVLVQSILGGLSLSQAHTKLDEKDHNRLQRSDGGVASTLGDNMVVEKLESTEVLVDGDKFLSTLHLNQYRIQMIEGPRRGFSE